MMIETTDGCKLLTVPKKTDNSYEVTLNFSNEDVGIMEISCFSHTDEVIYDSEKTQIVVAPDLSTIQNVRFLDESATFLSLIGEERRFSVVAEISDGNIYDVSSPKMGTSYAVADTSIAKITDDGAILALKDGRTTLTATNSGKYAQATIIVGDRTANDQIDPSNPSNPSSSGGSNSGGSSGSANNPSNDPSNPSNPSNPSDTSDPDNPSNPADTDYSGNSISNAAGGGCSTGTVGLLIAVSGIIGIAIKRGKNNR
jgi:hypothetical protein